WFNAPKFIRNSDDLGSSKRSCAQYFGGGESYLLVKDSAFVRNRAPLHVVGTDADFYPSLVRFLMIPDRDGERLQRALTDMRFIPARGRVMRQTGSNRQRGHQCGAVLPHQLDCLLVEEGSVLNGIRSRENGVLDPLR